MENKKYFSSIDIVKYLCAIMIVDSHVRLINIENSFLFDLFRFALYFFPCSYGYFFIKNIKNKKENVLQKSIKRLCIPLLFWAFIYFFINLYNNVLAGNQTFAAFIKYQFISIFINGISFHLWFLVAIILNSTIVYIAYKNKKIKLLYVICIFLYVIGLLGSYYYQIGNSIPIISNLINMKYFATLCRLILHGLPTFVMGVYIEENEEKFSKISNKKLIMFSITTFILCLVEIYCVINYANIKTNISSLGLFIFTFVAFILLKNNPMNKYENIAKPLKYISTFMYYSHPLFRTVLASLLMRLFSIELNSLVMSIVVVVLCTIGGFILYKINNKQINRICS